MKIGETVFEIFSKTLGGHFAPPPPPVQIGLSLSVASIFVTEGLFIYIYFLLFEDFRAGEKIAPTISLFFPKMIAYVSKLSCAKLA